MLLILDILVRLLRLEMLSHEFWRWILRSGNREQPMSKRQMIVKERPSCDCPTFHVFWGVQSSMYDSLCFFIPGPESLNGLPQLHQLCILQAHDGIIRSLISVRRETAHFYIDKNKHGHNIQKTIDNSRDVLCCRLSDKSQCYSPPNSSAWPIS